MMVRANKFPLETCAPPSCTARQSQIDGFLWLRAGIVSYTEFSSRGREFVCVMKGNEAMLQIIKSARRLSLSIAWTATMVVACATGLPGKAHAQTKIVEGFVSHGALQWPEYIASEFGWFKENGIDLDMLVVGAGAAQQVAAGALNLGYSGFPDFIRAINQGAPVRIVINAITAPPYGTVTKPHG